jgi:hypothetical protein
MLEVGLIVSAKTTPPNRHGRDVAAASHERDGR